MTARSFNTHVRAGFYHLPPAQKATYRLHLKHDIARNLVMGIADGQMIVHGREIYTPTALKVGLFTSTQDF